MSNLTLSVTQLAAAFELWDKRYRENPEEYVDIATYLLYSDPQTYGEEAANYFYSLVQELNLQTTEEK